jgi:hypothetical protein
MILAEGHSRAVSTDRILASMEIISRSHIQKHVVMTSKFADILRGSGSASPVSDIDQNEEAVVERESGFSAPTRDSLRRLARESMAAASSSSSSSAAAKQEAQRKLNSTAPSFFSPSSIEGILPEGISSTVADAGVSRAPVTVIHHVPTASSSAQPPVTVQQPRLPQQSDSKILSTADNKPNVPSSTLGGSTRDMSIVNSAAKGLKSTTPAGSAASGSEVKMDDETAYQVFEAIGVSPSRAESKPSATRLNTFVQNYLQFPQDVIEKMYRFSTNAGLHVCKIVINLEELGAHSDSDKAAAKEGAAKKALRAMQKHPRYLKQFLIKIPPDNDGNPTSTLLQFFQMHSMYRQGDELQGIYRSYMHTAPHGTTMPVFECRLTFKDTELGAGRGDTKRRAREEASRKVLRKFGEAISTLGADSIRRLNEKFGEKGPASVSDSSR